MNAPVLSVDIPELELITRGKVRDIYDFDGDVLVITTDRLSAFDRVLPIGVPGRGEVLCGLTAYWFAAHSDIIGNYLINRDVPGRLMRYKDVLGGRTMLTKRVSFLPVEFVVRGYLYGSAWHDYGKSGKVCGLKLKPGMELGERFPEPVFTPARKVKEGHDVNIAEDEYLSLVGEDRGKRLREACLEIFRRSSAYLESRGIILADTKMEFGLLGDTEVLVNELLTPDCSRFWLKEKSFPGEAQVSMDKQPLRDYLDAQGWAGDGPIPPVPDEIVQMLSSNYEKIFRIVMVRDV